MEILKHIALRESYDLKVISAKEKMKEAIDIATQDYETQKTCNHNIVVKFYGTNKSYCDGIPLYICLGCNEDLTSRADELESNPNINILDFSSEYWYDVSAKNNKLDQYQIVCYLQNLAKESEENSKEYTDYEFAKEINDNISYIMSNNNFKPL